MWHADDGVFQMGKVTASRCSLRSCHVFRFVPLIIFRLPILSSKKATMHPTLESKSLRLAGSEIPKRSSQNLLGLDS